MLCNAAINTANIESQILVTYVYKYMYMYIYNVHILYLMTYTLNGSQYQYY